MPDRPTEAELGHSTLQPPPKTRNRIPGFKVKVQAEH